MNARRSRRRKPTVRSRFNCTRLRQIPAGRRSAVARIAHCVVD